MQNQVNRLPARLITGMDNGTGFEPPVGMKNEVFGSKSIINMATTPKHPVCANLHKSSNSYFPHSLNKCSALPKRLSEVSEVVEVESNLGVNRSFDMNTCHHSPIPQRDNLYGSSASSFITDEHDELKASYNAKKIFVGGLPHGLAEDEFKQYFSQYGEIEDCVVMYDRNTGKPRGFGFITYNDEASIDLVMRDKYKHKIHNKWIECKRATPKVNCNE